MRRAISLGIVLVVLTIPGMATPPPASLVADLDTLRAGYAVPGFALTLWSGAHGLQGATAGLADLDSGRSVTAQTMFRIGSITKTFNALAVMLLVEGGRLDLDTPLRKIVPDVPVENPWADTHPVRIGHLLEHSSGLLDITREEFDHQQPFATLEAAFSYRPQARMVQWPPGLHFVYSNANAGLVGLVIERAGGEDYARFLIERVLRPLGMPSASLSDDAPTRRRLATGYDTDGRTPIPYWHMIFPPLGAINLIPREMGGLLELFLRQGRVGNRRLLSASAIERMQRPAMTLGARNGLSYGYGPGLDQYVRDGFHWYGHGGDGDGYLSHFAYNREADAGYFLTINAFKHDALDAMRSRVQDHLTQALPRPQPSPEEADAGTLGSPLTGTYVSVTRRFEWQSPETMEADRLQLVLQGGTLYTLSASGRHALIPVDAHLFRRAGQPLATIAVSGQDGQMYLQADFGNYRRISGQP